MVKNILIELLLLVDSLSLEISCPSWTVVLIQQLPVLILSVITPVIIDFKCTGTFKGASTFLVRDLP